MKDENITPKAQSEIISEEQMEDVLDLMIRSGTIPDPRIDDEKARQAKQEKARKVYHNTLLLFQRYRDIIWVLQSFTTEVATELDQPLSDIDRLLSAVDVQLSLGNRKLENQLSRTGKTRMLIDRVRRASPGTGNCSMTCFIRPTLPMKSFPTETSCTGSRYRIGSITVFVSRHWTSFPCSCGQLRATWACGSKGWKS